MANKYETDTTSFHILYIILEDLEEYIGDIVSSLTSNVDELKYNIFVLLEKNKKLSGPQKQFADGKDAEHESPLRSLLFKLPSYCSFFLRKLWTQRLQAPVTGTGWYGTCETKRKRRVMSRNQDPQMESRVDRELN